MSRPSDPFPFDHFSMADVARIEALRAKYADGMVTTHKVAEALGTTRDRLDAYVARNPRRRQSAA